MNDEANTQDDNVISDDQHTDNTGQTQPTELESLQQELAAMTETAKRALADLQNFKKRTEEEKKGLRQFAAMSLIIEILPVFDNFNRALAQIPEDIAENQWVAGITNIAKQFKGIIEKQGLTEITTEGEKFDPVKHEALMQGPGEKEMIIETFEPGYMLGDKVLKPAKVKVGDGSPQ